MGVRIIADTMCDVPEFYAKKHNIKVMPLTVHFGSESYKDGIDITMEKFFDKLAECEKLPTTAQIPPIEFIDVFQKELDNGNEIVCINGSSRMSGTYNSAVLAKNHLDCEKINIINSEGVTLGAGMLAIKAARLAEQGMDAKAIDREIRSSVKRMKYFYIVDTLKYLHKGGRISSSANVIGSILNIKPILTIKDGSLELIEKARGIKKAISTTFDIIKDNGWSLEDKVVGINHTISPENFKLLEEFLVSKYNVKEIIRGQVGSVVGTHAGPGAVAIYFEE